MKPLHFFCLIALVAARADDDSLPAQFDQFEAGQLPLGQWIELFEAVEKSGSTELKARLAAYERKQTESRDPLRSWRECLEGGDARAGREIFTKKVEAGCIRCHRMSGEGGEIGPDLTGLGLRMDRVFILESIVDPNAVITPSFPTVLLKLANGESVSGVVSFESAEELRVTSVVDGKKRSVKTAEIVERTPLPSAMPPGLGALLGKRAVRDLVEFIATSK